MILSSLLSFKGNYTQSLTTLYTLDDSESMSYEEEGTRIGILKDVLSIINDIYSRAAESKTGIRAIRFINNYDDKDYFHGEPSKIIDDHYFGGTTKIGTELHKRILKPLVLGETPMKKPLLIMVITDGAVSYPNPVPLSESVSLY